MSIDSEMSLSGSLQVHNLSFLRETKVKDQVQEPHHFARLPPPMALHFSMTMVGILNSCFDEMRIFAASFAA